jgi:hypothetical protein
MPTKIARKLQDARAAGSMSSTASAATPDRKLATCQPVSVVALITAPPVEKSAAAAKRRTLERSRSCDVIEPGTTNTLHLTGEIHVVTHVRFSEAGVPTVGVWANLVRVRGTSQTTGITYLGVGAGNLSWVGVSPGPPNIPEQTFDLGLVALSQPPGPPDTPPSPILPIFLRAFRFGVEDTNFGRLLGVEASFVSD